jgi:hypothetical protein
MRALGYAVSLLPGSVCPSDRHHPVDLSVNSNCNFVLPNSTGNKPTTDGRLFLRVNSITQRILPSVKKVEFISDRMSYIVLRGRWCNIIVLNAHAPTEEKNSDSKDSFYEELEQVFDHFPRYHMKILLGDFNAKLGSEDIFKPTIGKESLHEDSNDNGVRVVNFVTSKNLVVKSTVFPH